MSISYIYIHCFHGILFFSYFFWNTFFFFFLELQGEVGRRPANDRGCVDRESYALSAGIALGMVTLGQGGNVAGHLYKGLR